MVGKLPNQERMVSEHQESQRAETAQEHSRRGALAAPPRAAETLPELAECHTAKVAGRDGLVVVDLDLDRMPWSFPPARTSHLHCK